MNKIKTFLVSKLIRYHFHEFTLIKRQKFPVYSKVINKVSAKPINNLIKTPNDINIKKNIYYVLEIPSYVEPVITASFKKLSFYRMPGFLVNIEGFKSLNEYMSYQFTSKNKSKIKSCCKRLETCFNISYKLYFGSIDKQDYERLMEVLEHMIKRRWDRRSGKHQDVENLEFYKKITYQSILEKKASMFVIYDNEKPISIALNCHYENVMIGNIIAYDIDYAKFSLGNIDVYKLLEWCFENNYKIFDLGVLFLSYKKQWSNVIYTCRNDILFNKFSVFNTCFAYSIYTLFKLKLYFTKKNILKDTVDLVHDNSNINNYSSQFAKIELDFKITEQKNLETNSDFIEINIETDNYNFLRKTVYDYLYLNFENKNAITIYKLNNMPNSYCICGKKSIMLTQQNSDSPNL